MTKMNRLHLLYRKAILKIWSNRAIVLTRNVNRRWQIDRQTLWLQYPSCRRVKILWSPQKPFLVLKYTISILTKIWYIVGNEVTTNMLFKFLKNVKFWPFHEFLLNLAIFTFSYVAGPRMSDYAQSYIIFFFFKSLFWTCKNIENLCFKKIRLPPP